MMFGARADSEPILPSGDGPDRTKTSAPASAPTTENGEHANESQQTTRENYLVGEAIPSRGRFVQIDGSIGGSGYDETTVELVIRSSFSGNCHFYPTSIYLHTRGEAKKEILTSSLKRHHSTMSGGRSRRDLVPRRPCGKLLWRALDAELPAKLGHAREPEEREDGEQRK